MTKTILPSRVRSLRMQARTLRQHGAQLTANLTNLYGVDAAEVACQLAMADLLDAQAEHLLANSAFNIAQQEIMRPTSGALAFAATISVKVSLFKLANQLMQQSHALTLSNLLLQQATNIFSANNHDQNDQSVIFTLNQISQAAFELVDVEEFQTTTRHSKELLLGLN